MLLSERMGWVAPNHIVNGAKSGKQIKRRARDSAAWPTGAAMAACLGRTHPLSLSLTLAVSLSAHVLGRGLLHPFRSWLLAPELLPRKPLQLFPCVLVCDGIPRQSRNAKSAFLSSFFVARLFRWQSPRLFLLLGVALLVLACNCFGKEVPSNRVLNVKFKWQSSSNEMMLWQGAGCLRKWKLQMKVELKLLCHLVLLVLCSLWSVNLLPICNCCFNRLVNLARNFCGNSYNVS